MEMVCAAINPVDDGVGRSFELIVQPALNEATHHLVGHPIAMQGKASDICVTPSGNHRSVHGLDDISPNGEIAQRLLKARLEGPAPWGDLIGETKAFKLRHSTDHQLAQLRILAR
jgi:hypothetical protein